jgi:nucleotide-binding universal stress UspA family protein
MQKHFKHILIPMDFSPNSTLAIETALDSFGTKAETITMLTVFEGTQVNNTDFSVNNEVDSMIEKASRDELENYRRRYSERHQDIRTVATKGNPASRIISMAKELDADLIVMGSQGRNSLARAFFGGTTYQVSRKAHCSILVVRPENK